ELPAKFILALGLHTAKEMAGDGFEAYWVGSLREIANKGDLSDYWARISSNGRGQALEKVTATDLFYLRSMDEGTAVATARALEDDEGAHAELEGVQADLAPIQAPQPPLVVAQSRTMPQRMARLEEEVHGLRKSLDEQREVMDVIARDFSRFTVWAASGISQLLDLSEATQRYF
ncbi:hypothetical protein Tco_0067559, partial [Tanacetum coccineum]